MSHNKNMFVLLCLSSLIVILLGACAQATTQAPSPTQIPPQPSVPTQAPTQPVVVTPTSKDIILSTTTSTQDSGLLDVLVPAFEQTSGYTVKTVAVGTGQALKMGQDCNADVLLVHAPSSEVTYMDSGYGSLRKLVMHNDFIIVGPSNDPAGIKYTKSAVDAFKKIAAAQEPFISRGDQSGTNTKELAIWKSAGIDPQGNWYQESGQGMGATLKIASEKNAYTLTDRATYLANKDTLSLDILVEGDNSLLNVYHVIVVNIQKCPKIDEAGALAFANYVVSPAGQELIGKFGVDKFGQALFTPDANKTDADLGLK